jgi:hypothetical protein
VGVNLVKLAFGRAVGQDGGALFELPRDALIQRDEEAPVAFFFKDRIMHNLICQTPD